MLKAQPPVFSPVSASALVAPLAAAVSGGAVRSEVSRRIVEHLGARELLLLDSGTSALTLAIEAATDGGRLGPVALPAYGCYDLAASALGARAPVLLFDVDPHTLSPDLRSLDRCLSRGAAAVVVAHLYGLPADIVAVKQAVSRTGGIVIEDAAQAIGAVIDGRPAGAWGDVSVLSFGRGKGFTGGGGGALIALNPRGEALMRNARRRVGATRSGMMKWGALVGQWVFGRPSLYGVPLRIPFLRLGETRYRPPRPPSGMPAVWASALLRAWGASDREVAVRQGHAARLTPMISGRLRSVRLGPRVQASFLRLPVLAETAVADLVGRGQWRSLGIARGYPLPLSELPELRPALVVPAETSEGARELAVGLVTLPTHSLLGETDLLELERWVATSRV